MRQSVVFPGRDCGKEKLGRRADWMGRYRRWFFAFHHPVCSNPHGNGKKEKQKSKK
jgi:hypothetical protein